MIFLEEGDMKLRAVEPDDAERMWEIETDSAQWRDNGMYAPYSRRNLRDYAETYDADPFRAGQIRLVGELKGNCLFGVMDLYDISAVSRTAFVGLYITTPYRGQGLAAKSLRLLEQYAGELLNLRMLGAKVAETNAQSRVLFEHAGYAESGVLPDWLLCGHEAHSLIIYTKKL